MEVEWDIVIADEAHKASASVFGGEIKKTKRHQMFERLGTQARNLLLMTATPRWGKEERFQLFMGRLDSDRFEDVQREGTRHADTSDLMRRLVKEELLTFEGIRLFPERRSTTVRHELTDDEKDLGVLGLLQPYAYTSSRERPQRWRRPTGRQVRTLLRGGTVGVVVAILLSSRCPRPSRCVQHTDQRAAAGPEVCLNPVINAPSTSEAGMMTRRTFRGDDCNPAVGTSLRLKEGSRRAVTS